MLIATYTSMFRLESEKMWKLGNLRIGFKLFESHNDVFIES